MQDLLGLKLRICILLLELKPTHKITNQNIILY